MKGGEKMDNNSTRTRVNRYIEHYGTPSKFLSKQAGVNHTNFSTWINGNKDFSLRTLAKINNYIDRMIKGIAI
jgi:hypothetical protein